MSDGEESVDLEAAPEFFAEKEPSEFSEHIEILYNLINAFPDGISCSALIEKYIKIRKLVFSIF